MIPVLEFEDTRSLAVYLGRNEIPQQDNLNANARLFILGDGCRVAKIYDGFRNDDKGIAYISGAEKNMENLIEISERLSAERYPQLALPTALISFAGQNVGYEMPYIVGRDLGVALADPRNSHEEKIGWFNHLTDVILSLPDGVFIGDLHPQNVLVGEDGRIVLIDTDGFSLDSVNSLTCPAAYMDALPEKYFDDHGSLRISRDTDILCLFRMFFGFLFEGRDIGHFLPEWRECLTDYVLRRGMDADFAAAVFALFSNDTNILYPGMFDCWSKVPVRGEYQRFLTLTGLDAREAQAEHYLQEIISHNITRCTIT